MLHLNQYKRGDLSLPDMLMLNMRAAAPTTMKNTGAKVMSLSHNTLSFNILFILLALFYISSYSPYLCSV